MQAHRTIQVGDIFEWTNDDSYSGLQVLIASIHDEHVYVKIIKSTSTYKTSQILHWPKSEFLDKSWVCINNDMYERWHEIMKQE